MVAPTLTMTGTPLEYLENTIAAIDPGLIVFDPDSPTLKDAQVSIRGGSGGFVPEQDRLVYMGVNDGVTAHYDEFLGILWLTAPGRTPAEWQAILRQVGYQNLSNAPNTQPRTISFNVDDGSSDGFATRQVTITPVNDAPQLSAGPPTFFYAIGAAPTSISPDTFFSDPDNPSDFDGGALRIRYDSGAYATNQLAVAHQGTGSGQVGVSGQTVTYGGTAIGTWSGGANGSELTVTFNAAATLAVVRAVARDIVFSSSATSPPANPSVLGMTLSDGDGGVSAEDRVSAYFALTITSDGGGDTAAFTIAEMNRAVTTVMAVAGTPLTFAIVADADSPDAARFTIDPETGKLRFQQTPNFEAPVDTDGDNTYVVKVRASDGSAVDEQIITVNITDAPERTSFKPPVDWSPATPSNVRPWYPGDFNGDGLDDGLRADGSLWTAHTSIGTGFRGGFVIGAPQSPYPSLFVGDFTGDGQDDVLRTQGGVGLWVFTVSGDEFLQTGGTNHVWAKHGWGSDSRWYVGDFNGDGKDDIFRYITLRSGAEVLLSEKGANFYFAPEVSWTLAGFGSDNSWHVGDFNGDGKDDILRYLTGTGLEVFLSDGSSFVSDGVWSATAIPAKPKFLVGDLNGDGIDDLVIYELGGDHVDAMLSTGTAFAAPTRWADFAIGGRELGIGDFDGNGVADLIRINPTDTGLAWPTEVLL